MGRTSRSSDRPVCPACGRPGAEGESFCPDCAMPLVLPEALSGGEAEISERAARARKIRPQLAEGPLVKVAGAHHQAEAEFVQSLLLEAGVPSTLRRTRGFDVPDLMAAGPRDVLVPQSGAEVARDVLLQADLGPLLPAGPVDRPVGILLGLLIALALVALAIWVVGRLV